MRASEVLTDAMFHRPAHRRLFRAMIAIAERGAVIDPLTLSDELERRGELDGAGGKDYISRLVDAVPTAANVGHHAGIVREKARLRQLIEAGTAIVASAFDAQSSAEDLTNEAERRVIAVASTTGGLRRASLRDLIYPAIERIERRGLSGNPITGVPSGFYDLDEFTSGFQRGDVAILAARPGMGKSALMLQCCQHAAASGARVAVFSLEMSKDSLTDRLLAMEGRLDLHKSIRRGTKDLAELARLSRAGSALLKADIEIYDDADVTMVQMRAEARKLVRDGGVGLVAVDYLQLIAEGTAGRQDTRERAVATISRSLKALAKELNVPVLALSQLSREGKHRTDKRPQLSDLRDSGAIEQDADLVLFIHRPEVYGETKDEDNNSLEGVAEIIIGNSGTGPSAPSICSSTNSTPDSRTPLAGRDVAQLAPPRRPHEDSPRSCRPCSNWRGASTTICSRTLLLRTPAPADPTSRASERTCPDDAGQDSVPRRACVRKSRID